MSGLDDLDDLLGQLEGTKDAPAQSVANPTHFTENSSTAVAIKPVAKFDSSSSSNAPPEVAMLAGEDDEMAAALGNLVSAVVEANKPKSLVIVHHPVNLNSDENEILRWLNNVRTNPSAVVSFLRRHKDSFDADRTYTQERNGKKFQYVTKEGPSAVQEAISFLERQAPVKPLKSAKGLQEVARRSVHETGSSGKQGTLALSLINKDNSEYGEFGGRAGEIVAYGAHSAEEFIADFVICDGDHSRNWRKQLFAPEYEFIGISSGRHSGPFETMAVAVFAQQWSDEQFRYE